MKVLLLVVALVGCQCKREQPRAELVRRPLPPQQVLKHAADAGVP